ncbi:MAG: F-type H+-transporting ATPase subunit delta [Rhodothermales bacterium]|jgi:F-type H+-transporting ATPase subunit delta
MSSLTTLARPYAKAAFALAQGEAALAQWDGHLSSAGEIVSDSGMAALLGNPQVTSRQAISILADALGGDLSAGFSNFIKVLGSNDRLSLLAEISVLFRKLREEAEKRLSVRVISAVALEDDQAQRLKSALTKRFDCEVEMVNEVDASVLGGAVIYAGDQVIDGSLLGRLQKLQNSLSN